MKRARPASEEERPSRAAVRRLLVPAGYASLLLTGVFRGGGGAVYFALLAVVVFIAHLLWRLIALLRHRGEEEEGQPGGVAAVELGLLSLLALATVFQLLPGAGPLWVLAHAVVVVLLAGMVRLPEILLLPICAVLLGAYGEVGGVGDWLLAFLHLELVALAAGTVFTLERLRADRLRRRMARIRVEGAPPRSQGNESAREAVPEEGALHDFLAELKNLTGAHTALIAARSGRGNLFVKEIVSDAPNLREAAGVDLPGQFFHWIVTNNEPLRSGRVSDPEKSLGYYAGRAAVKSFVGVPVLASGRPDAVLALDSLEADAFPDDRVALLRIAAPQVSVMLANAREVDDLRRQARDFRNLHEVGRLVGQASRVSEVAALVLHVVQERLQPEFSALVLAAADGGLDVAGVGQSQWDGLVGTKLSREDGLAGWVLESGSYLSCDGQSPPPNRPLLADKLGVPRYECLLIHPLTAGEESFGALVAAGGTLPLDPSAVDFCRGLCQQVSFGLVHLHARDRLRALAGVDEATGLRTRKAFLARAEEEGVRVRRYLGPLSVTVVEVDGYASLRGKEGGQAAREVAEAVGRLLKENLRSTDVGAVWGEGRFALLLTESGREAAVAQAERLRQLLGSTPALVGERRLPYTASIGTASMAGPETDIETLIARAERRAEDARLKGGNRVSCGGLAADEPEAAAPH